MHSGKANSPGRRKFACLRSWGALKNTVYRLLLSLSLSRTSSPTSTRGIREKKLINSTAVIHALPALWIYMSGKFCLLDAHVNKCKFTWCENAEEEEEEEEEAEEEKAEEEGCENRRAQSRITKNLIGLYCT